jgi:hypothetical protein
VQLIKQLLAYAAGDTSHTIEMGLVKPGETVAYCCGLTRVNGPLMGPAARVYRVSVLRF